jgi:hypothetical protein
VQIFVTDPDPVVCAKNLDNKRLVKMVLETTQILSTVVRSQSPELAAEWNLYRSTHAHHPCVLWTADSPAHFRWLVRHLVALSAEYTARYGRTHACQRFVQYFEQLSPQTGEPTWFANCARNRSLGLDFTDVTDTFLAYRLYLGRRNEVSSLA